jgi:hypothetical protein
MIGGRSRTPPWRPRRLSNPKSARAKKPVLTEVHRGGNRAVGFRMTISPIADLFTDPRSTAGVGTFGDAAKVSALVGVS